MKASVSQIDIQSVEKCVKCRKEISLLVFIQVQKYNITGATI